MKLYFHCPAVDEIFGFEDYSLKSNYDVVEDAIGNRELKGRVVMNSDCPLCGERHQYEAKDVLCPSTRDDNDR